MRPRPPGHCTPFGIAQKNEASPVGGRGKSAFSLMIFAISGLRARAQIRELIAREKSSTS